ncbi:MAG: GYD domain-containing protein [Crenarchaeota archaeon]|nr:GYD domain-containing protein [Thermoproteota archaeon]
MEVSVLPVFVVLGSWTDQGIRKITEAPKRAKVVHDMVNKAGGKMQVFYTMGKYDFVAIIEVPKDDDVMAILLCLGSMGNVRTNTMKAWTEAEAAKIITAPHP